jgi:hypothetical protein
MEQSQLASVVSFHGAAAPSLQGVSVEWPLVFQAVVAANIDSLGLGTV